MESFGQSFLDFATTVAFGALLVSFALTVYRLLRGPSFADRVVALDYLMLVGIGFITVNAIVSGAYNFIDVAIAMALIGFLATVAFARFIYRRAQANGLKSEDEIATEQAAAENASRSSQGGEA